MIKLLGSLVLVAIMGHAKTNESNISTVTIKEGKKIYHPIQHKVIEQTVQKPMVQVTIKRPVIKAVSVDYSASN